jgi:hypothetical protein
MENKELQQYYEYLKAAKADVPPTYESFETTLADETVAKQYYQYLRDAKFDTPDTFESFTTTLGLKKKVASEYVYPTSKAFTGVASTITGNIPKDEPTTPQEIGPLEVPQDTLVKVPDISKEPVPTEEEKDSYASDLFERIGAGAMDIATSGPKRLLISHVRY